MISYQYAQDRRFYIHGLLLQSENPLNWRDFLDDFCMDGLQVLSMTYLDGRPAHLTLGVPSLPISATVDGALLPATITAGTVAAYLDALPFEQWPESYRAALEPLVEHCRQLLRLGHTGC